ncbi:hypothetical protein CEP52_010738 [Fusarium oligoseptatum]|uniref:Zn(2)-C6 fungal-type domain-containing protein n=1 Tax=Fusarium oligoseptatum TaxID=2604345 RepID=A0A428T6U6_9HYPO|nr:hypothetical protein CEP52_010738 [Fusarium oligoseptatum]
MVQKRACDACHKRKIQCDSTSSKTPCNWCEHHGLACTFNRIRGRKKKAKPRTTQSSEQSLAKRLERIEDALAQTLARQRGTDASLPSVPSKPSTPTSTSVTTTPAPRASLDETTRSSISLGEQFDAFGSPRVSQCPPIASTPSGFTSTVSFGQIHYGGCHFGRISQHNGMPILSAEGIKWLSSRTGEDVSFQKFQPPSPRQRLFSSTSSVSHYYNCPSDLYELPDRKLVDKILHVYLHSAFRLVFPVIDRVLFEDTLTLAYESSTEPLSLDQISAKSCVYAFISIICLFQGRVAEIPYLDSDACAQKAHYLLTDALEDTSITSLQAVFMLHMHQTFSGHLQSAAMLHAIACRIIFMLGGHTYTPTKAYGTDATREEREVRQLRMMFWLCYIFDKDIALRTGQPPLMSDDYCDLTLPEDYMSCYFYLPDLDENLTSPSFNSEKLIPHLPGDPRLSHLKDKTSRLLYSAQAVKKSDAELLRDIRELDEELEAWRLSIPPDFRPALSITEKSKVTLAGMQLPRSMRHITLHLEYHHLMTAIHRASGRCCGMTSENNSEDGEWKGGIHSSIALSLEASRSTLVYLRAAIDGLAGEAFWVVVFYPTAAMMSLFFNLLMNPLEDRAQADLELLSSAAGLVRQLPVRRLTPHELSHMKLVNDFVTELIRLCKCAIAKATKEREQRNREMELMSI